MRCNWLLTKLGQCGADVPDEEIPRVVIDTNVFISAAIGAGASTRLIQWWLVGSAPFEVVACPQLLEEISGVLARPRIQKRIPEVVGSQLRRHTPRFGDADRRPRCTERLHA